jgi:hypothetical protein
VRTLGIAIDPGAGNPKLLGVIVSGTATDPILEDEFELNTSSAGVPEQIAALARRLQAKLPGIEFDDAAIRVAGARPVASRVKGNFSRAHAEGAVLYVLREHTKRPIRMGDPKSFAAEIGMSKSDLVALANELSKSKSDAAVAAIAALGN